MQVIEVKGDGPVVSVDDDTMFAQIFSFIYARNEIKNELVQFFSGHECLEYLERIAEKSEPFPALILMDINMPSINGIEAVRSIRRNANFREIPIIAMLSSSSDEKDISDSLNAGADAYFEKPNGIDSMKFVKAK